MPRVDKRKSKDMTHAPLGEVMAPDYHGKLRTEVRPKPHRFKSKVADVDDDAEDERFTKTADYVAGKMGRKLLEAAADQQREAQGEDTKFSGFDDDDVLETKESSSTTSKITSESLLGGDGEDGSDDEYNEEDQEVEEMELTEADRRALEMYMPQQKTKQRSLADMIFDSMDRGEAVVNAGGSVSGMADAAATGGEAGEQSERKWGALHPKVIAASQKLASYMRHYTSGKVPKFLKIVPNLRHWEEVLFYAEADKWTPQALAAATRLFASNLKPHLAQRFYNLILLPKCRFDIEENKKLNFHLYQAVRKAIFKPTAFFKGIILPLVSDGCTAREAMIFSSILASSSIPAEYGSAALYRLIQMPYSGPAALFIKTLLNKKYALPKTVLDAVHSYYLSFIDDEREFPVLWHQGLLTYVQRYKLEMSQIQRDSLKALTRRKPHKGISEEIKRELVAASQQAAVAQYTMAEE